VFGKVADALNDQEKSVRGARVLVVGAAYKANISDVRESPAIDLIDLLLSNGANVTYHDPYVPELRVCTTVLRSIPLDAETVESTDCVVIETDHAAVDLDLIVAHSRAIVDTRNALSRTAVPARCHLVKL
jgi:UDP-N-acetyl-D-glucosamine dehydrogenase